MCATFCRVRWINNIGLIFNTTWNWCTYFHEDKLFSRNILRGKVWLSFFYIIALRRFKVWKSKIHFTMQNCWKKNLTSISRKAGLRNAFFNLISKKGYGQFFSSFLIFGVLNYAKLHFLYFLKHVKKWGRRIS